MRREVRKRIQVLYYEDSQFTVLRIVIEKKKKRGKKHTRPIQNANHMRM